MVFSSLKFIFIFLPVFLIFYSASEKKYRNAVVVVSAIIVGIDMFMVMRLFRPLPILIYLASVLLLIYESNNAPEKRFRCSLIIVGAAAAAYYLFSMPAYRNAKSICIFIGCVAILLLLAYSSNRLQYQNLVILAGSVIFYGLGVGKLVYIVLFLLTNLVNFIVGQFIENSKYTKKLWLFFGVAFNFWWLIFFKYWTFGTENINAIFHQSLTVKNIILPIGISFYTFQNVSYIADVYKGKAQAEKNLINYGAYISMFPQLIAGPIVTYDHVAKELKSRKHTLDKVEDGLKTFTIGLGYKVLIANQVGGLWSDISMVGFDSISSPLAWLGIFAYSFQLYFDFCGYSLMAIGLGKIMGFELPRNFDHPYMSVTMTEFWRRWHMTLGTWFKDYVYIPLGGNRKGPGRLFFNTLVVWLFTGLWHGASWNFVIWGLVLFAIIMTEKYWTGNFFNKHKIVGHAYMILIIPLTWLLFAVTDFHELGVYFRNLIPFMHKKAEYIMENDYVHYWHKYWKYFAAGLIFSTRIPEAIYKKMKNSIVTVLLLLVIFGASVYCMYRGMDDPFMYFRF
ncbi:MBOAT family O-acyltransferase [Ruminococcus sp.]|uniref:MBOAT family O-acyltransferase n=1 Tax=Ruminococcus sp. TaxID=41978 RepID=UPI002C880D03|nr:MBOAT family O-acyltransferase [Ruminococcus sp.]HNZ99270.1 MBOAT family O-acyltransferase [Ruminococcus sp.]HOH85904.1 MBOAT family O-acyltransferase [Ruminococcus sp.]